jgi:hypothetical protein
MSAINNRPSLSGSDIKSISSSQSQNLFSLDTTDSENHKDDVSQFFSNQNIDDNFAPNSKILNELRKEKMCEDDHKENVKFNNDLIEHIPKLYRLLDLCKDDGSNGLGI